MQSFDISVWQFITTQITCGTTYIYTNEIIFHPKSFISNWLQDQLTHVQLVPSYLKVLYEEPGFYDNDFSFLKYIIVTGETTPKPLMKQWFQHFPEIPMVNAYGPAETSDDATLHIMNRPAIEERVPVGKTLQNFRIYIFNDHMELCPIGVPGEIGIAGIGLGRGYLNKPDKTHAVFAQNPFDKNGMLYKTGDMGYWLPNGVLMFLGRSDDQVKINGHRIELGEINLNLLESGMIDQGVVTIRQDRNGKKNLVGYVIPKNTFNKEKLEAFLRKRIPRYMVPGMWVELESFPLNRNGKINRKALPEPDTGLYEKEFVAPQTKVEKILVAIWTDLLSTDHVGIKDNFFELGGDSITSIQVVSRARQKGYIINPQDLFEYQNIFELAKSALPIEEKITGEKGVLSGQVKLAPEQYRFFEKCYEIPDHQSQCFYWNVKKRIPDQHYALLVTALINHHDALRLTFQKEKGIWTQRYGRSLDKLIIEDFTSDNQQPIVDTTTSIYEKYRQSLDLKKGEVIRFILLKTHNKENHNRLIIISHQLVIDDVSWQVLQKDIDLCLSALSEHRPISLASKGSSFRQWVNSLMSLAVKPSFKKQAGYWKKVIASYKPLPVEKILNAKVAKYYNYYEELSIAVTSRLFKEANRAYKTEAKDLVLAALAKTICSWSSQQKIIIATKGKSRNISDKKTDVSRTVGNFSMFYPNLLFVGDALSVDELIKSIKEQIREVPNNGVGYGVLRYLHPDAEVRESLAGESPWNIEFDFQEPVNNSTEKWLHKTKDNIALNSNEIPNSDTRLMVNCSVVKDKLRINWKFSSLQYNLKSISALAKEFMKHLNGLIHHCCESSPTYTPSDFGLHGKVNYRELDTFLAKKTGTATRGELVNSLYPLSPFQEGIMFHSLFNVHSGEYVNQISCELVDLQVEHFRASWNFLLKRHSIYRTAFYHDDFSIPMQGVYTQVDLPFYVIDFSTLSKEKQEEKIIEIAHQDIEKGFDLSAPPLMRVTLIKLDERRHQLIWNCHHILMDGWSSPLLIEEVFQNYQILLKGQKPEWEQEDKFKDFIDYIQSIDENEVETFWRSYLQRIDGITSLPFPKKLSKNNREISITKNRLRLDTELTKKIKRFASNNRLTLNTVIQGVWAYLLSYYSGQKDVVYGVTVSGRPSILSDTERRMGPYINTIPLAATIEMETMITNWLAVLQMNHTKTREFQYVSLNTIQKWKGIVGDFFDNIIVFENYPVSEELMGENSDGDANIKFDERTNYPLTMIVLPDVNLEIHFDFNNKLMNDDQIKMIAGHFKEVLQQIAYGKAVKLKDLNPLSTLEKNQLRSEFNTNQVQFTNKTLTSLFEEQVDRSPDGIAVQFRDHVLTYAELNEKSNQLSHYLIRRGVQIGSPVGICLDRSLNMITGILGILKAGAAYVPIDPAFPKKRIQFILFDTRINIVITDSKTETEVLQSINKELQVINFQERKIWECPLTKPEINQEASSAAYIIYTSGSTGRPKGVLNEHRGVINRLLWGHEYFKLNEQEIFLQKTTFCFDVSIWELFSPLIAGGKLVFAEPGGHKDVEYLKAIVDKNAITTIHFVPSMLEVFLSELSQGDCKSLKRVICSGEALLPIHVRQFRAQFPATALFNLYGPTEAGIEVSYWEVPKEKYLLDYVPIGKPVHNTQLHILDVHGRPVPVGVAGELHIGGVQVARGYLNRPSLTTECFVENSLAPLGKLYRTGDLAAWLEDGTIKYLGRSDDQVKIHGYRIELGEINQVIGQYKSIKSSVVRLWEDGVGHKRLVAYVVTNDVFEKDKIEKYLASKLPDYMIPALWMEMESLPLNANGKIDKKALPTPDESVIRNTQYVAPRNSIELDISNIWKEFLQVDEISMLDDFFVLGGHSLLAIRLASAIRRRLDVDFSIREIFEYSTVEAMSKYLSKKRRGSILPDITISKRPKLIPLSFSQERLFFIDQLQGSTQYHLPFSMSINAAWEKYILEDTFKDIIQRHEVLRTVYKVADGNAYQEILHPDNWKMNYLSDGKQAGALGIKQYIEQFADRPFDLSSDYMFRALLIRMNPEAYQLVIVMHHIASDGWSLEILMKEFIEIFNAKTEGRAPILPSLKIQYADYAIWQRKHLGNDIFQKHLSYWIQQLGNVPALEIPTDFTRPALQSIRGAAYHTSLDSQLLEDLQMLSSQNKSTLYMTMLAAFKVLLYRYSGQTDICIGSPIAGREQGAVHNLIGFFVNMLAIRSHLKGSISFAEFLQQVRKTT